MHCSLVIMDLSVNPLGGSLPSALPAGAALTNNKSITPPSLHVLALVDCGLTGKLPALWISAARLAGLKVLYLKGCADCCCRCCHRRRCRCHCHRCCCAKLYARHCVVSIRHFPCVLCSSLLVCRNRLTGSIPTSWTAFPQRSSKHFLQQLDVRLNNLSGPVPAVLVAQEPLDSPSPHTSKQVKHIRLKLLP